MKTGDEILNAYRERKQAMSPAFSRMQMIKQHYKGYITAALPDLDINEQVATANLVTVGLDQMAMRIASVQPQVIFPPLIPGQRKSEQNARIRRLATLAWWDENSFDRKQSKRARWLIGYGRAPVMVRPDEERQIPMWQLQDPFCTFPGPMVDPDSVCPPDVVLAYTRPLGYLQARYPAQMATIAVSDKASPDEPFEVLEWADADEHVLICVGKPQAQRSHYTWEAPQAPGLPWVELARFSNRIGRCLLVYPTRVSLDAPQGQFDAMPALARHQAKAMALLQVANERAIFPEYWFISRPNQTVDVIQCPDGRKGIPGEVTGGDLKEINIAPPPQSMQFIQQLERNERVSAGISSDFGGEAPTNVRTGRAGDQLLGATVDFWIQEAQQTLGTSYRKENMLAIDVAREYFGNVKKSFYVSYSKTKAPVDYIPDVHFETSANMVAWPNAGTDANSLAIGLGQRLGLNEISIRTAQELDPYVDDPEKEHDRITVESMEKALLSSLDTAVAGGQLGPVELARIMELVSDDKMSLVGAIQTAHKEAQKLQAAQQAAQPSTGPPGVLSQGGQPGSPAQGGGAGASGVGGAPSMPGMMAPGQQALLGVGPNNPPGESVPPPSPSLAHLGSLMSAMRARSNQAPQLAQPSPPVAGG